MHVSGGAFLSEVFASCGRAGWRTCCTLWCQCSTAGRLHNKSHCVFSSLHLKTAVGPDDVFFLCACSFMNRKHVEKYEHHGNAFT